MGNCLTAGDQFVNLLAKVKKAFTKCACKRDGLFVADEGFRTKRTRKARCRLTCRENDAWLLASCTVSRGSLLPLSMIDKFRQGELVSGDRIYSVFLHVGIVVLIVLVVILAIQNSSLKNNSDLRAFAGIDIGQEFKLDSLIQISGTPASTDPPGRNLVFVYTTSCPYCRLSVSRWNSLSKQISGPWRVLGVCLDGDSASLRFAEDYLVQFPVFVPANVGAFREANKILGVPLTLILDESLQVAAKWEGELTAKGLEDVLAMLSQVPIHR